MASQVDVFNRALTKLGAARITSISDASKSARVMAATYDTVRKSELSKRYWNFALARTSLPALGTDPAWGFARQFQLPNDYLKLVQVNDIYVAPGLADYRQSDDSPWAIEGQAILTDFDAPLKVRYIRDITDTGLWHPLFVELMASKLAYEACYEITQSRDGQRQAGDDYKQALKDAALSNAIERPPVGLPDDSWSLGRL
jgi:hypothetical protein